MTKIKENVASVRKEIEAACKRAGRETSEITLIAVSKTKPIEMLSAAYDAGSREFGENKVQEICAKYEALPSDTKWHMIGHLQTNKVKQVIDKACLIHSVDSYKLAAEISKEAVKRNIIADILIEVNVADEDTKYGVQPDELDDLVLSVSKLPGICIRGLMTVAPFVENPEENRPVFRKLKQLCVDLKTKNIDNTNMDILSMGMTNDYAVAIEEGATMVRVGTGIFGERNYNL